MLALILHRILQYDALDSFICETGPSLVMTSPADPDQPAGHSASAVSSTPSRRQELEHRLKDARGDRDAYLELAGIYRSEGRPMQASKILKQGHEVFPDDTAVLWEYEEAQLSRSIQQLTELRQMYAKSPSPLADQDLERSATDWANCRIRVCRARLARDPSLQHLRLICGEALHDLERYSEAIEELQPLLDHDTHSSAAALLIGRCHLILSSDIEAMHWLRIASMRRSVTAPPKVRVSALKLLIDLAERHGLTATLQQYQATLTSVVEAAKHSSKL